MGAGIIPQSVLSLIFYLFLLPNLISELKEHGEITF